MALIAAAAFMGSTLSWAAPELVYSTQATGQGATKDEAHSAFLSNFNSQAQECRSQGGTELSQVAETETGPFRDTDGTWKMDADYNCTKPSSSIRSLQLTQRNSDISRVH